ncbi:hypothetical protein LCAZH_0581 [Lacticaseibacillus paracasei]|nr:hypothetical protein LCAZH_0581 [Lacticaseibacillus paracasei]
MFHFLESSSATYMQVRSLNEFKEPTASELQKVTCGGN